MIKKPTLRKNEEMMSDVKIVFPISKDHLIACCAEILYNVEKPLKKKIEETLYLNLRIYGLEGDWTDISNYENDCLEEAERVVKKFFPDFFAQKCKNLT